ncbi:MAG: malto-oligosyltrehalose trehalohydrolase, partial [Dehalococcoidia bacterium]
GAYQGAYTRQYYTERHETPWGAAINLDGPGSAEVRATFIEIALHWLHEYHVDGFRLDATNELKDDSPLHFLAEWAERVRAGAREGVRPYLIAEDSRNLDLVIRPRADGGYGFDEVLADDFHHELRRIIAGDHEGYYRDYRGSTRDLATELTRGWLYAGEWSEHWGRARGTDPTGIPLPRFGHCIQNHDQVGNRALGERLHHDAPIEAVRAASALLLTSAATPMLFMGQEWAASTPFLFFSDHHEELGRLVTAGRRREFAAWSTFAGETIPDPQAVETFRASRLDWSERDREPHASMLRLYRALLALRREEPALRWSAEATQQAFAPDDDQQRATVVLVRRAGADAFATVACLRGSASVEIDLAARSGVSGSWEVALTTEDEVFAPDALPVDLAGSDLAAARVRLAFRRPGAVLLRARAA